MKKLLKIKDLAERMGYSERHIRRLVAQADEIGLPYIKICKGRCKILFREDAIEAWLKSKEIKPWKKRRREGHE